MKSTKYLFAVATLVLIVLMVSCGGSEDSIHTIYWTDFGTKMIHRANMDGTGEVEDLITLSNSSNFPSGIALKQ